MESKINEDTYIKKNSSGFADLLSKDGSDFKAIVSKPLILEGLNCNVKEVRQYLSKHLPRLLKTALRDDTTLPTLSAMKILTSKKSFKITNLVKTPYFSNFTTEYLSKDNISPMLVGRLSEIALNLFRSGCNDFFTHAGFVILFLKFIDYCSVCELFVSLFDFDEKLKPAQDWLFEIGFDNEISSLLQNLLSEKYTSDAYTLQQENKISLLKIINKALDNPRTRSRILEGPILSVFTSNHTLPTHVNNFYWQTINKLYDNSTKKQLLIYANEAHNIFINPIDSIHIYYTESLNFMEKYVNSNPELFDSEFVKSIITLMMQFENCELFLIEAANLFITMCKSDKFSTRMIKYASLFINEADDSKRSPFQIISLAIAKELATNPSTSDFFQKIELPPKFIKKTLNPYIKKLNSEYGVSFDDTTQNITEDCSQKTNKMNFWDIFAKVTVP